MKNLFTLVVSAILSLSPSNILAQDNDILSVDDVVMPVERQATISINITGATQYMAAGMYVNLPEGFNFVYNEKEESYAIGGDVLASSHYVTDNLNQKEASNLPSQASKMQPLRRMLVRLQQ